MSGGNRELREFKHTLATPVTNLLCQLEMLVDKDSTDLNLLHAQNFNNIITSATQLRELVGGRDLSLVVREAFSLEQELTKVIAAFNKPYHPQIQLIPADHDVKIFGHRRIFDEAIQALLNNAVEAYNEIQVNRRVKITIIQLYQQALIFFNDLGKGMNRLTKMCFGRRNFSTKNWRSGLGVAKVKNDLATYFAGELQIWYSKPGLGSAIVMVLPVREQ